MRFLATPPIIAISLFVVLPPAYSRTQEETRTEPTGGAVTIFDFEDAAVDGVPTGFTAALTGSGGAIDWRVQQRDGSPSGSKVVAQLSADETNGRYPHLVLDGTVARDVEVSVSFKTISGEVDASGGVLFRYRDKDNFYVVRANALENNVVAYKTENGRRSNIGVKGRGKAYGVELEVPHQEWNQLRVIARGRLFKIFLNGVEIFEVEDDTFEDAGRVGLWTKADAVTEFDDLRVQNLD